MWGSAATWEVAEKGSIMNPSYGIVVAKSVSFLMEKTHDVACDQRNGCKRKMVKDTSEPKAKRLANANTNGKAVGGMVDIGTWEENTHQV